MRRENHKHRSARAAVQARHMVPPVKPPRATWESVHRSKEIATLSMPRTTTGPGVSRCPHSHILVNAALSQETGHPA